MPAPFFLLDVLVVLAVLFVLGLAFSGAPRRSLRGLGLLLLLAFGCGSEKKAAPVAACDGASSLRIAVQPGDYLHVVADQESRDAVLTLFDPRGRQLLKVDSLTAESEPHLPAEEVHWVADSPGELRIELTLPA